MGRTSHRRYRRERDATLAASATCWLCGQPINGALRWPDPMSASADHVDPHALGGDDGRGNLRAAHLRCNSKRGKRDRGTVMRRSTLFAD